MDKDKIEQAAIQVAAGEDVRAQGWSIVQGLNWGPRAQSFKEGFIAGANFMAQSLDTENSNLRLQIATLKIDLHDTKIDLQESRDIIAKLQLETGV